MRLFISIDLPESLADEVEAVQDEFSGASGLNFVDPTQVHVTVKFLGDADEDRVSEIIAELERAVDDADIDPFTAVYGGLGVFPSTDYISVLWLGVEDGSSEMTQLHEAVEPRMVDLGFDPESHDFTPHVTLARMNHAGGKELVLENLETLDPTVGSADVTDIRLTESNLRPDGPEYSTVERIPL